jgi:hypothetical protein
MGNEDNYGFGVQRKRESKLADFFEVKMFAVKEQCTFGYG